MNTDKKKTGDSDQIEISERDLSKLAQGVGIQVRKQTIELKKLGMVRLKAEIELARRNFKKIVHNSGLSVGIEETANATH
jgi:hypothetical protein